MHLDFHQELFATFLQADSNLVITTDRPFHSLHQQLQKALNDYRSRLEKFSSKTVSNGAECLSSDIYSCQSYVAFGSADTISFSLLDAFHPFLEVSSHQNIPVEQSFVAFCPVLNSNSSPQIVSPRKFLHSDEVGDLPLVAFSKLKISGLATLGLGAVLQNSILKKCAKIINFQLKKLLEYSEQKPSNQFDIQSVDVAATRVCILLSLGADDLIVIVKTSNYSIATSLIVELRELKIGEVANEINDQCYLTNRQEDFDFLTRFSKARGKPNHKSIGALDVFVQSHTTLGVSMDSFANDRENIRGLVEVRPRVQISPGQLKITEEKILNYLRGYFRATRTHEIERSRCHRVLVGQGEYETTLSSDLRFSMSAVELSDFIGATNALGPILRNSDEGNNVLSYSTHLIVPVPQETEFEKSNVSRVSQYPNTTELTLSSILSKSDEKLFGENGRFCKRKIDGAMRAVGLPMPLRRAVDLLFKNLRSHLNDQTTFDMVLDLLDYFNQLYEFIVDDLKLSATRRGLEYSIIQHLGHLVDAAQSALHQRTYSIPNSDLPDHSLAWLKGGLNQLVSAVDVPFKCGLGLLKWCKTTGFGKDLTNLDFLTVESMVAGATRLSYEITPRYHHVRSKPDTGSRNIVVMDMVAGYIVSPFVFVDCFHESFHLVLDEFDANAAELNLSEKSKDRRREIFADLMTVHFIFGRRKKLFPLYNLLRYDGHPQSNAADEYQTMKLLVEVIVRTFVVDKIGRSSNLHRDCLAIEQIANGHYRKTEEWFKQLEFFFSKWCNAITHYKLLRKEVSEAVTREMLRETYDDIVKTSFATLGDVAELAFDIYQGYASSYFPWKIRNGRRRLQNYLGKCIDASRTPNEYAAADYFGKDSQVVDGLMFASDLMNSYLWTLYKPLLEQVHHTKRNSKGRLSISTLRTDPVQTYYVDKCYPELFSWNWEGRRKKLDAERAVIEGLWSLSCRFRGRRLSWLFEQ